MISQKYGLLICLTGSKNNNKKHHSDGESERVHVVCWYVCVCMHVHACVCLCTYMRVCVCALLLDKEGSRVVAGRALVVCWYRQTCF